jgi:nitrogen fixation/metabolism regulation signal transduction histidine kinase
VTLGARWRGRLRETRWVLGGLAALLFVSLAVFVYILRGKDLPSELIANRVLLYFLWNLDALLILTILFVLVRNLVKLFVERQRRILGARLRTKLVVTYIGLALGPVLLLFFYGASLIRVQSERLFAAPVRDVLAQGNALARSMQQEIETGLLRDAGRTLRAIADVSLVAASERPLLDRRLRAALADSDLHFVAAYDGLDFVHAVVDPRSGLSDLPEADRGLLRDALGRGSATQPAARVGGGRMTFAAAAAEPPPGAPTASRPIAVVGRMLAAEPAAQTEGLIQAFQQFRQLEVQRADLRASDLLLFLLVTLLIVLGAAWLGLYLSRRVTAPIQALAEATERISLGDLGHRVEVEADDELRRLVGSFNAMTAEVEKSRAELIQAQQTAAWSEAAKRLAHEIKNPLTPIQLAAERLLERARSSSPVEPALGAALEDAVAVIRREVASMNRMVDEFSRFARMPRPMIEEVEVEQLFSEVVALYRELKPGVTVAFQVDAAARTAWFDREQIKRALLNLLDNALEATSAPGTVDLSIERRPDHALTLRVRDTGRGIPPEARAKLFLPHFSTKGRGTGLGLAIVQRIVADHGGTVKVESNEPQGTVFTIELPQ